MNATSRQLLHAAAEILGGKNVLAGRLGVEPDLLDSYMSGSRALPDALLLRAVDIILADRQQRIGATGILPKQLAR
jgi:hypothetical protein